jgi:hypothetical protein
MNSVFVFKRCDMLMVDGLMTAYRRGSQIWACPLGGGAVGPLEGGVHEVFI